MNRFLLFFFLTISPFMLYAQVVIDSVTINSSGKAVVAWQLYPNAQTVGYKIYDPHSNPPNIIIGSRGITEDTFTYNNSQATSRSESFKVAAVDNNNSPFDGFSLEHRTLFVSTQTDQCNAFVDLNWNTYINWVDGVKSYDVWLILNNGTPVKLQSSLQTTYHYAGLLNGNTYEFFVRAVSGNGTKTSTSNHPIITGNFKKAPDSSYISNVTVISPDSIQIDWIPDNSSTDLYYNISLSTDQGQHWSSIKQFQDVYKKNNTIFIGGLNTDYNSYSVDIGIQTFCPDKNIHTTTTNSSHSILLKAEKISEGMNLISWSAYTGWKNGVGNYALYRIDNAGNTSLIRTFNSLIQSYTDNDPIISQSTYPLCYYVLANEASVNSFNVKGLSKSNIACAFDGLKIFVPDGFNTVGENNLFKPRIYGADLTTYQFIVFNRFGQKVYETRDINGGWDGKMNGVDCEIGVYVFYISVEDKNNTKITKQGTVSVIK